jgi:hypothetical protein
MPSRLGIAVIGLAWLGLACGGPKSAGTIDGGNDAGTGGDGGSPLIGTWDLTTTPSGSGSTQSVVSVGQDQLTLTSAGFNFSLVRSGNVLQGADVTSGNTIDTNSTQSAAAFDTGIIPFNLGGTWSIQGGAAGSNPNVVCSLQMTANQTTATCSDSDDNQDPFNFTFTQTLGQQQASSFGALGGSWSNTWTWEPDAGTYDCVLDFAGQGITTCNGGGHILENITFQLNGDTASGNAQGTEFTATRR